MNKSECELRTKLIEFLSLPGSYPHKPHEVSHIQTHISDVFIAGPFVYKVKKPVDFGFLDYTSLGKRKHLCEKEVALNSRLSDVYLGVEKIFLQNGEFALGGGEGEVCEYAVKMRLLDESFFLANLLAQGRVSQDDLLRLVAKLVRFYKSQTPDDDVKSYGEIDKIKQNIYENLSLIEEYVGKTVSEDAYKTLSYYNDAFFIKAKGVFEDRVKEGRIRDCHGDLHLEHINITPQKINIYDCIEFNDRFRYIDIASDVGFLSMDLDYNGYRRLGDFIVDKIAEELEDGGIKKLLDFYKCYRALVRAKVASLKSSEAEVPDSERLEAEQKAHRYMTLGLKYSLLGSAPSLLVTFGVMGSGKSTLAGILASELSCPVFSSDVIRKGLAGLSPTERVYEGYASDLYSKSSTAATYSEMLKRGSEAASENGVAIVDATFSKREFRDLARKAAADKGVGVVFIEATAPVEVIRQRLADREEGGRSISDGRLEIFDRWLKDYESPDEISPENKLTIDTSQPVSEALLEALKGLVERNIARSLQG